MPSLGTPELSLIFLLALLLFGAKWLPEAARSLGQAIGEFRRAIQSQDLDSPTKQVTQSETPLLVFISSQIGEFAVERREIAKAIAEIPVMRHWIFEQSPASSDALDESYLNKVASCDIFVQLLGEAISEPVVAEYRVAQEHKKPCLIFVRNDRAEYSQAVEAYMRQLDLKWAKFHDAEDLCLQIKGALSDELVKGYRRYRLSAEQVLELIAFGDLLRKHRVGKPAPMPATSLVPEMILIPAGKFLMGIDLEKDKIASPDYWTQHILYLPNYYLAKTPVTNAQYAVFVQTTGRNQPHHWEGDNPPRDRQDHPVVNVSWHDAIAYCKWLSEVMGKPYRLPSEAEWEKGARGTDGRIYPWGNRWDVMRCNTREVGMGDTTPVGAHPQGASPYGLLDMVGNVWEWCSSLYQPYPYNPDDGREDSEANGPRVLRGGSWAYVSKEVARCSYRYDALPSSFGRDVGFRVVVGSAALSPWF